MVPMVDNAGAGGVSGPLRRGYLALGFDGGISARAQQTGYFLGLPRLCGFTGTSFVLGVPSSRFRTLVDWNTYWFRSGFSHQISGESP